ncbi:transposase [Shewanella vesiculosa]|uniref:transposase n=1 Tax=Shewanella vesiculosa TaxID=518738 RepID=UPI00384C7978
MKQHIFKKNMVITRVGQAYKIESLDNDVATLRHINNQVLQIAEINTLLMEYQLDQLVIEEPNCDLNIKLLTDKEVSEIKHIETYMHFLDMQPKPSSEASIQLCIETCALTLKQALTDQPSVSTIRRMYKKWLENDKKALYCIKNASKISTTACNPRISHEMRLLIDDIIHSEYLVLNGPKRSVCYMRLLRRHKELKLNCKMVSRSTFYREVNKIEESTVIRYRQGSAAATKYNRSATKLIELSSLFERCEMDAVHVKIYLVDSDNNIVGTPIIFFVMDVFSRVILGMHISLAGAETTHAAISALRHAILPKPVEKYDYLEHEWECHGSPMKLYVDSGSSFINANFDALLSQLTISRINGPSKQAWRRPHVERFNKTFRGKLEGLPGYLGKKVDGFEYNKPGKAYATLTLEEFEKIVCHLIVDEYHNEPHSGLNNLTPMQVWQKHIAFQPPYVPKNVGIFDIFLSHQVTGTIQQLKGLQFKKQFFNSNELRQLYIVLDNKTKGTKVQFYVDESDATEIIVHNPLTHSVFKVQNTRKSSYGKSFEELKAQPAHFVPNDAKNRIAKITQEAEKRKRLAARDKVKSNQTGADALSFENGLQPEDLNSMLSKRNNVSHSAINLTDAPSPYASTDKQVTRKPKIKIYKSIEEE